MKTISLKIDELIFGETDKILTNSKTSRNKYINDAIAFYNKFQKRQLLENRLKIESALIREDSMKVLEDFEKIGYAD